MFILWYPDTAVLCIENLAMDFNIIKYYMLHSSITKEGLTLFRKGCAGPPTAREGGGDVNLTHPF